jgi:diacylglycerol kinase (ATP)
LEHVAVIFNPRSGRGGGAELARRASSGVSRTGRSAALVSIDQMSSLASPPQAIIAVGGDGTARGVVEYFRSRFSHCPPVCFVPAGTANLLSIHLRLNWNFTILEDEIEGTFRAGRTVDLDVGTANGRPFLLMCGIGFDAAVVRELDRGRSGPISHLSYALPLARTLLSRDRPTISARVDDRDIEGIHGLAMVANVAEYGAGFSLCPGADSRDGLLDLTLLPRAGPLNLATYAALAATRQLDLSNAVRVRGRTIDLTGDAFSQVDGEPFQHLPLRIELLPQRQRFIVRDA